MIRDLDDTLKALLKTMAPVGSLLAEAQVSFDLPDGKWRGDLQKGTVNLYLYDIRENVAMRTNESMTLHSVDKKRATRIPAPVRIDCAYCITAWSVATTDAVLEEHRLLTQVLKVLLQNPTIPKDVLQGALVGQISPYPTVVASQDGVKNQPEFWHALDQKLKPSLNYIVTLAMSLVDPPADAEMAPRPTTVTLTTDDKSLAPKQLGELQGDEG